MDELERSMDLHLRSTTMLLRIINMFHDPPSPLVASTTARRYMSGSPKRWAKFLDGVATLLVRERHHTFATAACIRQNEHGHQVRTIVYTSNPPTKPLHIPDASDSYNQTPKLAPNGEIHNWSFEKNDWVNMALQALKPNGKPLDTEVHAANLQYFYNKIQEKGVGQFQVSWSELMKKMGSYVHIASSSKIHARFNYNYSSTMKFKDIFQNLVPQELEQLIHTNDDGELLRRLDIPDKLANSSEEELAMTAINSGFLLEMKGNHILYSKATVTTFNKFIIAVFSVVQNTLDALRLAHKQGSPNSLLASGELLYTSFGIFRALLESRAFWLHINHPAVRPPQGRRGFNMEEGGNDIESDDDDELRGDREDEAELGHANLILKWVSICAAHRTAVESSKKIANRRFSPTNLPLKPKLKFKEGDQNPSAPSMKLEIKGIHLPIPLKPGKQEPLEKTLAALLHPPYSYPQAIQATEVDPDIPAHQMTVSRLQWYLQKWAAQQISLLEANQNFKRAQNLLYLISSSEQQKLWSDRFIGTYHCESAMASMLCANPDMSRKVFGNDISELLSIMYRVIGVSKRSCPTCVKFIKLQKLYINHTMEHNPTDKGYPTNDAAVKTSSCHCCVYGWVMPPLGWGTKRDVVMKLTESFNNVLHNSLVKIVDEVERREMKRTYLASFYRDLSSDTSSEISESSTVKHEVDEEKEDKTLLEKALRDFSLRL